MNRQSLRLRGYSGPNPFHEAQAKTYGDQKIAEEFFPTSTYWSLFNEQHEILLGTRGSGKTVVLKMLSYSCLRLFKHQRAKSYRQQKTFIGFYVPLHLEFMASLPGRDFPDEKRLEYFQFAFNCAAAKSFLSEVCNLLEDCFPDRPQRLQLEYNLLSDLGQIWFPGEAITASCLKDLQWQIEVLYHNQEFWPDGAEVKRPPFARPILSPIVAVLRRVSDMLGLDPNNTNWIACIDEAEFLPPAFIKCINNFLRSSKRPLIVKLATLPFKHSTRETLEHGVSIEPRGNDFNYRVVELSWDSEDFVGLTNHLSSKRLAKCNINTQDLTLESFLGVEGDDDLIDYYKLELPAQATTEEQILQDLLAVLSEERQKRFDEIRRDPARVQSDYFKKFSPVYYVRRMKAEDSRGNRAVGWFAGAKTFRRVADGNPRRFIQLMNDLVEAARARELTPKNQHRIVVSFCDRHYGASEGLPGYGLVLKEIVDRVGQRLALNVHGPVMINSGCNFRLDSVLVANPVVDNAIKLGIAYSIISCDEHTLFEGLDEDSELGVSHICAVQFWLPMRKGDPVMLRSRHSKAELLDIQQGQVPVTRKESREMVRQLELEMTGSGDDPNAVA